MTLSETIGLKSCEVLRRDYENMLLDWAKTDSDVRSIAAPVLSDAEVNGDSYGVPGIVEIVEALVKKIKPPQTAANHAYFGPR